MPDDQRRQETQHVAVGAGGQDDEPLGMARFRELTGQRGIGPPVPGVTSSIAIIAPRPRTSPIAGCRDWIDRSRSTMIDSIARAAAGRSSSRIVWMAPNAAAQATGLPP